MQILILFAEDSIWAIKNKSSVFAKSYPDTSDFIENIGRVEFENFRCVKRTFVTEECVHTISSKCF